MRSKWIRRRRGVCRLVDSFGSDTGTGIPGVRVWIVRYKDCIYSNTSWGYLQGKDRGKSSIQLVIHHCVFFVCDAAEDGSE